MRFFRRTGPGDDRWLQAKLWLFGVGAVLAVVGIALDHDWIVAAAAAVLLAGVLLRFLDRA